MFSKKKYIGILFALLLLLTALTTSISSAATVVVTVSTSTNTENETSVIIIGWDGAGRRETKELLDNNRLPNLKALTTSGSIIAIDMLRDTATKAGWAEYLTGYRPEKTGVFTNDVFAPIPDSYTILERIELLYGDSTYTAFIAGKEGNLGASCTNQGCQPYYYSKDGMDFYQNSIGINDAVASIAINKIRGNVSKSLFMFIHFREPDYEGHHFGEASVEYKNAIVDDDYWLGKIMGELQAQNKLEDTLIYVVSDHGFNYGVFNHYDAPYAFLGTNQSGLIRRGDRIDLAPTIYEALGVDYSQFKPEIDGYPLTVYYTPTMWDGG